MVTNWFVANRTIVLSSTARNTFTRLSTCSIMLEILKKKTIVWFVSPCLFVAISGRNSRMSLNRLTSKLWTSGTSFKNVFNMFACIRNLLHLDKWRGRVSSISRHQWFWSATLMPVWRFLSFQGLLYSKFLIKTGKLKVIKFSKLFFYSVCVVSRVFIHINNMAVPNFDRIHLLVQIPRSRQTLFQHSKWSIPEPKREGQILFHNMLWTWSCKFTDSPLGFFHGGVMPEGW